MIPQLTPYPWPELTPEQCAALAIQREEIEKLPPAQRPLVVTLPGTNKAFFNLK